MSRQFSTVVPIPIDTKKDYNSVIDDLAKLMPVESQDRIRDLAQIIKYISGLFLGDDIHQYALSEYQSKYTKKAIDELLLYIEENMSDTYKDNLREIQKQNETLKRLLEMKKIVEKQTEDLEQKVKIENDRLAVLKDEEEKTIKSLEDYKNTMRGLNDSATIIWEKISDDHPLYSVSGTTIKEYILRIKHAYMQVLNISEEECKNDFILNESGLDELIGVLSLFDYPDRMRPIRSLLQSHNSYEAIGYIKALRELMKNIKLPKVVNKNNTSRNNTNNDILKELQSQRILLEAKAREEILKSQINTLVELIYTIAPDDFDYSIIDNITSKADTKEKQL